MLGTPERWNKILALIPESSLKTSLEETMPKCNDSKQRWQTIKAELHSTKIARVSYTISVMKI